MVLLLTIALAACGGDSGTSAPSDEDSSSSWSDAIGSSSSSSVVSIGSSSLQNDKQKSSSSVKKESSSSVKTVSSSSSVIPASSGNLPSSSSKKDGGSSSAMTSSSSSNKKVESSSSEYVPFDHSHALAADWRIGENRYKTFVDPRNGRSYYYITITGRDTNLTTTTITVMAENLNVGKMVLGEDDQNDDGAIERYCYNNDTTYCDEFGGLYQWAEMMQLPSRCNTESCSELILPNHQGICPDGWRLFTYNDYRIVRFSEGNEEHGVAGLRSGYRFNGYNTTGFSLVGAGYRSEEKKFENLNEYAFWFFPTEKASEKAYVGLISITNDDGISESDWSIKQEGLSVRCVKLE
ncbi:FISUMP domain-containing protein [uncultured Fibrobacter sp.]|nr:FISUMP domain-containing protein [uncultured Fibrobacter sp.]